VTKKKEEVVVHAPSKPVARPGKKAEKAAEKALEEERFSVLGVSHKVGTRFGVSVLTAGLLLLCLSAYVTITGHMDWMEISTETAFLGVTVWTFVGVVSIVGGLLLMGSD
jgi:hypothetical protein